MAETEDHILAVDVGGTHIGAAIFAHYAGGKLEPVQHETYRSRTVANIPGLLRNFLRKHTRRLDPPVRKACVDFAGPVGPKRSAAFVTNLGRGFTADQIIEATGIREVILLNDFEAVGYGVETLMANHPDAFVRLSRAGKLPSLKGPKPTAVVIGAGTGLGTTILVSDSKTGMYRPIPGEGGHSDFVAVEEHEFRIAQWIRKKDRKSTRLNSSHSRASRMPSSA